MIDSQTPSYHCQIQSFKGPLAPFGCQSLSCLPRDQLEPGHQLTRSHSVRGCPQLHTHAQAWDGQNRSAFKRQQLVGAHGGWYGGRSAPPSAEHSTLPLHSGSSGQPKCLVQCYRSTLSSPQANHASTRRRSSPEMRRCSLWSDFRHVMRMHISITESHPIDTRTTGGPTTRVGVPAETPTPPLAGPLVRTVTARRGPPGYLGNAPPGSLWLGHRTPMERPSQVQSSGAHARACGPSPPTQQGPPVD